MSVANLESGLGLTFLSVIRPVIIGCLVSGTQRKCSVLPVHVHPD